MTLAACGAGGEGGARMLTGWCKVVGGGGGQWLSGEVVAWWVAAEGSGRVGKRSRGGWRWKAVVEWGSGRVVGGGGRQWSSRTR